MLRRPPQLPAHFVALSLTAVLLALSYPLPGWSFLAWVALAPAGWLAAVSRRPWTLVWTSALVFGIWWVWMLRWLWPVTLPGALATAIFQSLFWVLALWATNVCVRRQRVPIVVALPLVWVSLEFVRSTWPWGGFAWFTLAQTQGDWQEINLDGSVIALLMRMWSLFMAGASDIIGAFGLSFAIAMASGFLIQAWNLLTKRQGWFSFPFVWCAAACPWLCSQYGISQLPEAAPPLQQLKEQIRIAVIQTNTPHSNKLSPTAATYEADFAALSRLHAEAARQNAARPALIVWPETVIPGPFNEPVASQIERWAFTRPDDEDSASLRARTSKPRQARSLIAEYGIPTLVGSSTELATDDPRDPLQFNSAYLVGQASGLLTGGTPVPLEQRYDKMHRVPFGEYIPLPETLKKWVLSTVSPYDFDYSIDPGSEITIFEVPAGTTSASLRFATPICFEDTNAALCRAMVYDPATGEKRVDVLVNLTTNGWFGRLPDAASGGAGGLGWESMRYQHLQLASLRAIENRVPVVRSVNTGVSAIIDSTGRIITAAAPGTEGVVSAELVLDPRRTVYAIVGDWPIRGLTAVTAGLVLVCRLAPPVSVRRRRGRSARR